MGVEHRNLKCANIFVEYSGNPQNYKPKLLFSDRFFLDSAPSRGSQDNEAFANIMHQLIAGLQVCYLASGKPLFHEKAKNSAYFGTIKNFLDFKHHRKKFRKALQPSSL
jgi:hypothetical protein